MSAKRMKPRTTAEQVKFEARQVSLESALDHSRIDALVIQDPAALIEAGLEPLSVGRYLAAMCDVRFPQPRLPYQKHGSSERADWLQKMIDKAIGGAVAAERQRCFAILNRTIRDIYAGGPDGNTAQSP